MPEAKNNIEDSFELTLKDANVQDIGVDLFEVSIDSVLDEGMLKDLPIVGAFVAMVRAGINIQDKLFLKKLLAFLGPVGDISADQRKKMIEEIDKSKKYRVKVGEKLLYIIDKCDDYEIAEVISKVFKYFLEGHITYSEFLKTATVLNDLTISDFRWFTKERGSYYFGMDDAGDMMSTGLFELHYEDIHVDVIEKEQPPWKKKQVKTTALARIDKDESPYETEVDGGMAVFLTRAGEVILEVFCPGYKEHKEKNTVKVFS